MFLFCWSHTYIKINTIQNRLYDSSMFLYGYCAGINDDEFRG